MKSNNNARYFDSFHILKEIKNFIRNKIITTNIYRIKRYNLIMCGNFYLRFIDFMLKGKNLLEYKNLFSPNEYKKNDKIILNIFNN